MSSTSALSKEPEEEEAYKPKLAINEKVAIGCMCNNFVVSFGTQDNTDAPRSGTMTLEVLHTTC